MDIIKTKKKGTLIVISGPCGCGKGTVINKLMENSSNMWLSVSMTSRPLRGEETNGCEYYFVTREEFEEKIKNDEFYEYAIVVNNQYYGTPKTMIEEKLNEGIDVVLEIDVQGALQVKEKNKDAICIFIMPPTLKELKDRLINRGTESNEKMHNRFQKAYKEINTVPNYNFVVVNDDIDEATKKVEAILLSEKCSVERIEELDLGNHEELLHEFLVDINQD